MYFVYILSCRDGTLYTGSAVDVQRRFAEHKSGKKGAKYTRSHIPERIVAVWGCESWSAALSLERRIKQLKRSEKLALISDSGKLYEYFGTEYAEGYIRQPEE